MLRCPRMHASFVLGLLGLAFGACGSPPPPAAQPAAPLSKAAVKEEAPPPDLSAVPRPEALVVYAHLSKPEESLKIVGGWTHLPMPGADVVSELLGGAPVGKLLDLSQPLDLAVVLGGDARSPDPQVAVSAAVKSLDEVRGLLGDKYKLVPSGTNGVLRIDGFGGHEGAVCDLVPAFGAAAIRLVCADGSAGSEALEPWLARSAPRDAFASDVHVELRMAAVRPIVKQFRGMLPMMLGRLVGARSGAQTLNQAVDAAVADLADFSADLDVLAFDVTLSEGAPGGGGGAADATLTASFGGTSAVLTRLALAHPERADAPPPAFWHAPVDADVAYYTRGIEPRDIAHARELGQGVLLAAMEKQGMPEADRKALVDPVMRYLDLHTGAMVYAKGVDMAHIDKARGELDRAKDAARGDAETAYLGALGGWSVVQTTEPIAKVSQIAKDLSAALARPGLVKWAKGELHGAAPPAAKITPAPKAAQLPDATLHLEVTVSDARVVPDAKAAPKTPPGKPRTLHVVAVPDAGKTWIVLAADLDLAIAKAKAVLPGAPDAGTLAGRAELGAMKDGKASSAGFVSARGLLAPSPFRYVVGGASVPRGPLFEGLANTPAQGATPAMFTTRAEARGVAGSFVMTGKVPRAALEDLVKVAIKRF